MVNITNVEKIIGIWYNSIKGGNFMITQTFDISINISVSIPILGDESIMLVQPPANFRFQKIALEDYRYKDRITDHTGKILSEFRGAIKEEENPYIICLEQSTTTIIQHDKSADSIAFINGSDFDDLIKPIYKEIESNIYSFFALLHLYKEGEIARKHSFYTFDTQEGICKSHRFIDAYCEDIITLIRYPMVIMPEEVTSINDLLFNHEPAYQMLKSIVIDDLEYSYHTLDDATNYKNLMTPLEVMFLHNDYGDKKIMLAKRIAVFLGTSDVQMKSIYDDVKNHYRDRSEAVHEGSTTQITHASVDELRALVRATTKQYIHVIEQALSADPSKTFEQIKRPHIVSLKNIVDTKNNLNIW